MMFLLKKLLKPTGKLLLSLSAIPAAVFLFRKHADVSIDGKKTHLYTLGKRGSSSGAVVITDQTPSKLLKKAAKYQFKK